MPYILTLSEKRIRNGQEYTVNSFAQGLHKFLVRLSWYQLHISGHPAEHHCDPLCWQHHANQVRWAQAGQHMRRFGKKQVPQRMGDKHSEDSGTGHISKMCLSLLSEERELQQIFSLTLKIPELLMPYLM